jgi:hypothetical protein
MIPFLGWDKSEVVKAKGLHPEANESAAINITTNFVPKKDKTTIYAALML